MRILEKKQNDRRVLEALREIPDWFKVGLGATTTLKGAECPIEMACPVSRFEPSTKEAVLDLTPMLRDGTHVTRVARPFELGNVRPVPAFDSKENFRLGANLPWANYGQDFGNCKWGQGLARNPAAAKKYDDAFSLMARSHVTTARIFVLSDGRAGIDFDDQGMPRGLSRSPDGTTPVLADLDVALSLAKKHGISLHLSLLDFHLFLPKKVVDGVQMGGRAHVLEAAEGRRQLVENVLKPMVEHVSNDSPHCQLDSGKPTVEAIEIINEPDWVTKGLGTVTPAAKVAFSDMRVFLGEAVDMCQKVAPEQFVTVGSAHASQKSLGLVRGLNLDFYQAHWYPTHDLGPGKSLLHRTVEEFELDRPLVLGEFPSQGFNKKRQGGVKGIAQQARESGYGGAFCWSLLATDEYSAGHRSALSNRPEKLLHELVTVAEPVR